MEEEERSLESFLKWAAKLGISDSAPKNRQSSSPCLDQTLCVSHFPGDGGRGLAAARDLRQGDLILRVPKSALFTSQSRLKDEALSLAVNNHPSLSSTQILTVCLLYEMGKGKRSWWYPYLIQLPRSYDILASFGQFETQALQVSDAVWAAEKAISKAEFDWKQAIALMKELDLKHHLLTFKAWLWAAATISSRTLHVPWDDAGCLCPVGDLFNYAAPGEEALDSEDVFNFEESSSSRTGSNLKLKISSNEDTTTEQFLLEQTDANLLRLTDGGYEEDVFAYCFYARRNYKKGEQVLLSYGTYTNLELLEHYGFLLDRNPNDKAFIPLEPEIYSLCSWPKGSLYIHQEGKPSFALLSALRLWVTPLNQRRSVGHLIYSGSQLSAENEIIVMEWLANNCQVILKNFSTSIEEDKLLLCTIDRMQNCDTPMDLETILSTVGGEARTFLETKGLTDGESRVKLFQSRQIWRCVNRWKLAVQWRLGYKTILANGISYCNKVISQFPSKHSQSIITTTHHSK